MLLGWERFTVYKAESANLERGTWGGKCLSPTLLCETLLMIGVANLTVELRVEWTSINMITVCALQYCTSHLTVLGHIRTSPMRKGRDFSDVAWSSLIG